MQHPLLRAARATAILLAASLAASLAACGGASQGWQDETAAGAKPAPPPPKPKSPPGRFFRAEVDDVLVQGPAWILQRVVSEEVIRDGAFAGWRIVAMPEEWSALALKPGDIVTRVNGARIERPDDLWSTWVALASARELRIAYEHEGAARELVMPIDGAPTELAATMQSGGPPARPGRKPKGTIVIEEGAPPSEADDEGAPGASRNDRSSAPASAAPTAAPAATAAPPAGSPAPASKKK